MSTIAKNFGSGGPKGSQQETNIERIFKLKECCDLLLAAGYHRARVSTLTPFDRVVGGMVWAMTNSNFDVDIDLLFTENATIGQRIKLADVLTAVLRKVKCPYSLLSHQIQGLDYPVLFPILQWLVKRALETRRETGDLTRLQSVCQFSKSYDLFAVSATPSEPVPKAVLAVMDRPRAAVEPSKRFIFDEVASAYQPKRKFKKRETANFESLASRTDATLLEYGEAIASAAVGEDAESADQRAEQKQRRGGTASKAMEEKEAAAAKAEAAERQKKQAQFEQHIKSIQAHLEKGGDVSKISGSIAASLIGHSASQIKDSEAAAKAVAEAAAAFAAANGGAAGDTFVKDAWQVALGRQIDITNKKIAQQETKIAEKKKDLEDLLAAAAKLKQTLASKAGEKDRLEEEAKRLSAEENNAKNQDLLSRLRALVALNESLKQSEVAFKLNCKNQRTELTNMLKALGEDGDSMDDEDMKRMREVERLYAADVAKVQSIRNALAKKSQEISRMTRLIDEIPTRAELLQYERRFVELYELVAAKLKETKKYFDLYNTLGESHKHMTTEVSVLNSITDGFPKAMKSVKGKESFLESFKEILAGIKTTSEVADKELANEVTTREVLNNKYNVLLEKQRNYFKAVKEFQEECFRNERLTESIERYTRAAEQTADAPAADE